MVGRTGILLASLLAFGGCSTSHKDGRQAIAPQAVAPATGNAPAQPAPRDKDDLRPIQADIYKACGALRWIAVGKGAWTDECGDAADASNVDALIDRLLPLSKGASRPAETRAWCGTPEAREAYRRIWFNHLCATTPTAAPLAEVKLVCKDGNLVEAAKPEHVVVEEAGACYHPQACEGRRIVGAYTAKYLAGYAEYYHLFESNMTIYFLPNGSTAYFNCD